MIHPQRKMNNIMKIGYYVAIIALVILFWLAQPCYANPINPNFPVTTNFNVDFLLWLICPLVEAAIITSFIKSRFTNPRALTISFIIIAIMNWITIPITQIFARDLLSNYFEFHTISYYVIYLAEVFPLITESVVLILIFHSFSKRLFSKPISIDVILLLVLIANIVTFFIGFIFYRYYPAPYNPARL
jgi:hypothetical protein